MCNMQRNVHVKLRPNRVANAAACSSSCLTLLRSYSLCFCSCICPKKSTVFSVSYNMQHPTLFIVFASLSPTLFFVFASLSRALKISSFLWSLQDSLFLTRFSVPYKILCSLRDFLFLTRSSVPYEILCFFSVSHSIHPPLQVLCRRLRLLLVPHVRIPTPLLTTLAAHGCLLSLIHI